MKRITTILSFLMLVCMGTWAITITYSTSTGTYTAVSGNGLWASRWESTASPKVTISVGANNIQVSDGAIYSGASECTYTISVATGYYITGYTLKGTSNEGNQTLTPAAGGSATTFEAGVENTLTVSGLKVTSTSFNQSTPNKGIKIASFTIEVEQIDPELIAAKAAITSGYTYRIYTYNNGSEEGSTKYYLTSSGTLTDSESSAGAFTFTATTSTQYTLAGYAWFVKCNGVAFSNPNMATRDANIHRSNSSTRQDWDAQVFYLKDGKYAVRATNAEPGGDWQPNACWTVNTDGTNGGVSDGIPEADYAVTLDEKHYVWQLESPISITYNVKMGGNTVATGSVNQLSGTAASLPASLQNNYCDYGDPDVSTVSSVNNVVNYNATLKDGFPFEYSTDYENATWYYWKLNGNYASYTADDTACPISTTKPTTDNGLWAFIGTPYGTKIINKAAGDGKYMQNTGSNPKMTSTETSWIVARNSNKDIEYFTVHSGANNYMNASGGNIAYWNSSYGATDNGSTFTVETYSLEYATDVATYISPYFDTHGEYFSLKDDVYTANSSTWTAAKETCDKDTYDALYAIVTNTDNIVYPATGYYLLKNNNTGTYLNTTASVGLSATDDAPSSIVRLTKNNDGTYYIESQGMYIHTAGSQENVVRSASALAYTPVIGTANKVAFYDGKNNGAYGYLAASGSNVINFPARGISTDPQSYWIVEDAPTSITLPLTAIGDNTYATTYLPFDATVSGSDVTANAVVTTNVYEGYVRPTALADNKIPAGTPVILKGSSTSATSATLTINTSDAFSAISGTSALSGVYVNTDFALNAKDSEDNDCTTDYFLGMLGGALGFYHSAIETVAESGKYTLSANRAYLPASVVTTAGSRGFSIKWNDDELTGISGAKHLNDQSEMINDKQMFDLQGRRVENPQRGLYIVGGRKIVIK